MLKFKAGVQRVRTPSDREHSELVRCRGEQSRWAGVAGGGPLALDPPMATSTAASQVDATPRRPSYIVAGTMSFRGASGDRTLRSLSTNALSGKGPMTFDRVTASQAGMHYFVKFCTNDDMSSESVLFWIEVRSYAQLGPGIHRELAARKIYNKFFAPASPMQLALPAELIDEVTEAMTSHAGPDATLFDGPFAEVSYTLRYDVFPRFVTSSHYFKLVNLTLEEQLRIDLVRDCRPPACRAAEALPCLHTSRRLRRVSLARGRRTSSICIGCSVRAASV